ncbi:hypothetical protein PENNAL_c0052G01287 [Penicillium nalgiovense]|uniref:DUF7136 domain-containing protein n=1 Tax=Penicillium nalgiovense TaxID=60175 RepID=A0A1V6XVX9_PENNA|nr:hypothetical protein PENNAL_c0052G01287 [Penicillium nalgiovense]
MYASNNQLYLGCLLALQACTRAVGAAATSGTLEIDLVFPRNETYAPSALMPVVLAIQNPALASSLNLDLYYMISPVGNYNNSLPTFLNLNWANISDSDPYFVYNSTDLNTEGTWELNWFLGNGHCRDTDDGIFYVLTNTTIDSIIFTTKNDSSKPDLATATEGDTCAKEIGMWSVENTLNSTSESWGHDTCAVLSKHSPTSASNPCGVKLNSTAASSISAALTAAACAAPNSTVSCEADENAAGVVQISMGMTWLIAVFGGLTYILA